MRADGKTKAFLACGAIAGPLFLLAVLIEGSIRSDYNPLLYPLSSLAIGNLGWMQISNFIITGLLVLFFSIGLNRVFIKSPIKFRGPLLIGLVGIGLIGAGIFITDPVFGYPTNKPLLLKQVSFHGHLHDLFSMLVFVCVPAACFVFRKRFIETGEKGWAIYSTFTGVASIVVFIFTSMGFKQVEGFVDFAGLFQRLCVSIGWTWMSFLSVHLLRKNKINYGTGLPKIQEEPEL